VLELVGGGSGVGENMLKPGDLLDYGRSISKLLRTEDWEALVTVIFFSLVIGFFLGWLYYRFLDPRNKAKRAREKQQQKADQSALGQALTDEGEIWRLYPPKPPPTYQTPINVSRPQDCCHCQQQRRSREDNAHCVPGGVLPQTSEARTCHRHGCSGLTFELDDASRWH
jgi:hypothetical protein